MKNGRLLNKLFFKKKKKKNKKNDVIPKHMQLFFSQLIHSGWEGGF